MNSEQSSSSAALVDSSAQKTPTIVYIAGYGRSGSTLLDTILGNQPGIFGCGEICNCFVEQLKDGNCSCGLKQSACPFWGPVFASLKVDSFSPETLRKYAQLTADVDGGKIAPTKEYVDFWRPFFLKIAEDSQCRILVDSSKTARLSRMRAVHLANACDLSVKVIHLVRDPRAVAWSVMKNTNLGIPIEERKHVGGMWRTLFSWYRANKDADRVKAQFDPSNYLMLRYEDFVSDTEGSLGKIGDFIGMDLGPVMSMIQQGSNFSRGHGISGNRVRREGKLNIKLDDAWKSGLSKASPAISKVGTVLANRYGY